MRRPERRPRILLRSTPGRALQGMDSSVAAFGDVFRCSDRPPFGLPVYAGTMPAIKRSFRMRRRSFIRLLGTAAALPVAAFAQHLPRVGVLLIGRAVPSGDLQIAAELARIGYVEGRNIAYEIRGADGDITRLPALARELVAARPEVYSLGRRRKSPSLCLTQLARFRL